MKKHILGLLALFTFTFFAPLQVSAATTCNGSDCIVTFEYTGTEQQWSVPAGASNIRFYIYGASGARGGAGGSVTGTLRNLPNKLFVYVGGQGSQGRNASGGFNGGGAAGGNRGNEGSGGGASDIRTSPDLASRIAVAGGGGGGGGYSGATGAAGGGLEAPMGGSGQGGGGGGGTQTAGGGAGYSNGGTPGTAGGFGIGGTGGTSWNAGGGGGGGGWYGGGGGGADDNDCCADGGGGGGGSSYASVNYTQNVTHEIGVNSGHGRIEIHFTLIPTVESFTGEQLSSTSATFRLVVSEPIVGLEQTDFAISGCQFVALEVSADTANVHLGLCDSSRVELTLGANTIGASGNGPTKDSVAGLVMDLDPPSFSWVDSGSVFSVSSIALAFDLSEGALTAINQFELDGCLGELVEFSLRLSDCPEGERFVSLKSNVLTDEWENLGPATPVIYSFIVDTTPPTATWTNVEVEGSGPFTYSAVLNFSKQVSFSSELVSYDFSMQCETGSLEEEYGWIFWASCGYGSGSWTLPELTVADSLGNLGPVTAMSVSFENFEPVIPTPDPVASESPEVPIQEPQEPAPVAPTPTQPEPSGQPVEQPNPQPEVMEDPLPVNEPTPVQQPVEVVSEPVVEEVPTESQEISSPTFSDSVSVPTESSIIEIISPVPEGPLLLEQVDTATSLLSEESTVVETQKQLTQPETPSESAYREDDELVTELVLGKEKEDDGAALPPWTFYLAGLLASLLLGLGFKRVIGR